MIKRRLDTIYVAGSARDARFTRICVASIRHFYPSVRVKLLAGGSIEPGLSTELARHWDVIPADVISGDWGWGFVKLEPLFACPGERFLVLDSDTAFVGPVLQNWQNSSADFMVDDEHQSQDNTHRLYYDWRKVAEVDPEAGPPAFVFNSGQWFGTAGVIARADFEPFVDWRFLPPKLRHPSLFMPGDQGVLNYVLNQKATREGLSVDRRKIMRWPGHGMVGVSEVTVAAGTAPPVIVHWAGYKAARLGGLPGADILRFFERKYYERLPFGPCQRIASSVRYMTEFAARDLTLRIRMRFGR